jgi:hypothetical protein
MSGIVHLKHSRFYANGIDGSGSVPVLGTWGVSFDATQQAALSHEIKSVVKGWPTFQAGPVNTFLSPGVSDDLHALFSAGDYFNIMAVWGSPGGAVVGDPICAMTMEQGEYTAQPGDGFFGANVAFPSASRNGSLAYPNCWGLLVHPKGAETAANTAVATLDNGAASAAGGLFVYHLFSSDGTATLSLDDSATNANNAAFAALSGATSGSIDASVTPKSGMIALGTTAAVRRYLRWQIALGTATTATFALGFIRG